MNKVGRGGGVVSREKNSMTGAMKGKVCLLLSSTSATQHKFTSTQKWVTQSSPLDFVIERRTINIDEHLHNPLPLSFIIKKELIFNVDNTDKLLAVMTKTLLASVFSQVIGYRKTKKKRLF